MTDTKEVVAYVIAHLGGYVVGYVVNMFVLVPIVTELGMVHSQAGMMGMFFVSSVIIQIGVFFLFILIRNRRVAGA